MDDADAINRGTYDAIAAAYDARQRAQQPPFLAAAMDRVAAAVPRAGRVVDVGCGPAWDVQRLCRRGLDAVGVDRSAAMLCAGAGRVPGRLVIGDLRALPLRSRAADGVWSSYALLHVSDEDLPLALREVRRVLRPGGVAVLITASAGGGRERVAYAPEHERVFFARSASALAAAAQDARLEVLDVVSHPDGWRAPVQVVAERR